MIALVWIGICLVWGKFIFAWAGFVVGVIVFGSFLIFQNIAGLFSPEPSQQRLAQTLTAHGGEFARFVQLCNRAPRVEHIRKDDHVEVATVAGNLGADDQREKAIELMTDDLGILSLTSDDNGGLYLELWVDKHGFRGPVKGIVYSTKPLAPLFQNVDSARGHLRENEAPRDEIYARLAPNWYAYYAWE